MCAGQLVPLGIQVEPPRRPVLVGRGQEAQVVLPIPGVSTETEPPLLRRSAQVQILALSVREAWPVLTLVTSIKVRRAVMAVAGEVAGSAEEVRLRQAAVEAPVSPLMSCLVTQMVTILVQVMP